MSNLLNSMTGEMIEELRQYGDVAQDMVSNCDHPLLTLEVIAEAIRVAVRQGDRCLYAECVIVYQTLRNSPDCYGADTLQYNSTLQDREDFLASFSLTQSGGWRVCEQGGSTKA